MIKIKQIQMKLNMNLFFNKIKKKKKELKKYNNRKKSKL
jgi:hypothetical protein